MGSRLRNAALLYSPASVLHACTYGCARCVCVCFIFYFSHSFVSSVLARARTKLLYTPTLRLGLHTWVVLAHTLRFCVIQLRFACSCSADTLRFCIIQSPFACSCSAHTLRFSVIQTPFACSCSAHAAFLCYKVTFRLLLQCTRYISVLYSHLSLTLAVHTLHFCVIQSAFAYSCSAHATFLCYTVTLCLLLQCTRATFQCYTDTFRSFLQCAHVPFLYSHVSFVLVYTLMRLCVYSHATPFVPAHTLHAFLSMQSRFASVLTHTQHTHVASGR